MGGGNAAKFRSALFFFARALTEDGGQLGNFPSLRLIEKRDTEIAPEEKNLETSVIW